MNDGTFWNVMLEKAAGVVTFVEPDNISVDECVNDVFAVNVMTVTICPSLPSSKAVMLVAPELSRYSVPTPATLGDVSPFAAADARLRNSATSIPPESLNVAILALPSDFMM